MIETTEGLILRTRPLTETSLIVCWLTRDFGRVSTVAKGARRPKSPFRGKLDLFYSASLSFRRSRHSELHNLTEVVVLNLNPVLRRDLALLRLACYGAELVEVATEDDTPLPEVYALMCDYIKTLEHEQRDPRAALAFELKLLEVLGLSAGAAEPGLPAALLDVVEQLTASSWEQLRDAQFPKQDLTRVGTFLRAFISRHLGRVPRSRDSALVEAAEQARTP